MEESTEKTGGRRTRSGRKSNTAATPAPQPTQTRGRRTRKAAEKITEVEQEASEDENLNSSDERKDEVITITDFNAVQSDPETECNAAEVMQTFENTLETHVEADEIINESSEKQDQEKIEQIEQIFKDSNEENLLQYETQISLDEQNDIVAALQNEIIEFENQDIEMIQENKIESDHKGVTNLEEENCSFPFEANNSIQQSENSESKVGENIESANIETVDCSLLASLAGDNANSLPSVDDECHSKDHFDKSEQPITIENEEKIDENSVTIENEEKVDENSVTIENEVKVDEKEVSEVMETSENPVNEDETSHSENAIAEDLPNGNDTDKTIHSVDAEMISEDELQHTPPRKPDIKGAEEVSDEEFQTPKIKVKDAEEVSDEELPAPKRAELPADAEVISDEELPNNVSIKKEEETEKEKSEKKESSKRKAESIKIKSEEYNPGSPTGEESVEEMAPEKKIKIEVKEEFKEKKKEKKKLPELEKYWKAVKDDPTDFTGWTYLLQYVDQETDVEAAREAYDAFLGNYPYCYGYWRKYADYEKRKGDKEKCYEVFERGLCAIPLSVDLWMHYLNHVKTNHGDNEEFIRQQFDRAVEACGLEFRSDKLWELYIKWESEAKRYYNVTKIYDRLLAIPTQGYNSHFESFQDLITNHSAALTVGIEEFKKLRHDVREAAKRAKEKKSKESDSPPGDELLIDDPDESDDHVRSEEEMTAIKDKIISNRRKIHKTTVAAVTARWIFEEGIKRPYFHVKALERSQLKNWKEYLDFEIEKGDKKRILILFERCLIACALYEEFWQKLIRYLEALLASNPNDENILNLMKDAYRRACKIHHKDKPSLHLMWSAFEEVNSNHDIAADILTKLDEKCPNLLQVAYRRINLERRRGNLSKCEEYYEYYIKNAKNKNIAGSLCIKYARFCHKLLKNIDKGLQILKEALEKDPGNTRVALQMVDMALQREVVKESEVVEIMDKFSSRENIDPEQKVLFAQRKVEFLEDFGSTAKGLQEAQRYLQHVLQKANEAKKKKEESASPNNKSASAKDSKASNPANAAGYNNANAYYNQNAAAAQNYYSNSQQQQYQQSYDSYGYNHWQYGQGYSGYGQWSGYGNYY